MLLLTASHGVPAKVDVIASSVCYVPGDRPFFGHLTDGVYVIPTTDMLPEVILLSCHCNLTLITVETGMN